MNSIRRSFACRVDSVICSLAQLNVSRATVQRNAQKNIQNIIKYMHFKSNFKSRVQQNNYIYIYIYIRGGTVHVFVPNRHSPDLSVMLLYNEYRQITEGAPAVLQRCLITGSRRTANAMSCALENKAR